MVIERLVPARWGIEGDVSGSTSAGWGTEESARRRRAAPAGVTGEAVIVEGLRDRLIGAWKLVSYEEHPVDGVRAVRAAGA